MPCPLDLERNLVFHYGWAWKYTRVTMTGAHDMDRLLSIAETSVRTTVPVPTLRFYRHKHTGPTSFKLGGRVVYKESDVEAWIDQQYDAGTQAS
jgi:predicted DNA-binding transcriptional regulator AlpA